MEFDIVAIDEFVGLNERIDYLEAENERLRKALEKIAAAGDFACCHPIYSPPCGHSIARAALEGDAT